MKTGSFLILFMCFSMLANAQTVRKCATMEALAAEKSRYPYIEQQMQQIEDFTQKWIQDNGTAKQEQAVITIPVVVHVVYTTSNLASNISEAQIQSQIDVLNEDFRRLNADTTLTPAEFSPFAADSEFEFCLAQRDPNDLPSNGITRTPTTVSSFDVDANTVKFSSTGGIEGWPANKYLNIWVCNYLQSGGDEILGYAQFPGGSANTDGVVISYPYFGNTGAVSFPFNKGRTATHEIGHWLNLRHIWGDDFGGCSQDDMVNDTPRSADAWYGCPSSNPNTCVDTPTDYNDMYQNYMDYCDDACLNIFTNGQKQRMRALFSSGGARFSLTQSNGCVPVDQGANDVVLNGLEYPTGTGNCTTVEPIINVRNLGSDVLYYFIVEYGFTGGTTQTYEWTGSLNTLQTTSITLPAINTVASGIIHYLNVNLTSPNGLPDFNPANNQNTFTFATISGGSALPFFEGFEPGTQFNNWFDSNSDGLITFEVNNTVGSSGNGSVYMNNFIYNAPGAIDEFILPHVNLNISNPYLSFDVAYALVQSGGTSDVLQVLISTNCGNTYSNIFTQAGNSLTTAAPNSAAFVPTSGQWRTETISLAAYQGVRNAVIKFKQIRGAGNNLYVDNLNITDGVVGISTPTLATELPQLLLYPNPVSNKQVLALYKAQQPGIALITITDISGRNLFTNTLDLQQGINTISLPLQNLSYGMYLINLKTGGNSVSEKLMLVK